MAFPLVGGSPSCGAANGNTSCSISALDHQNLFKSKKYNRYVCCLLYESLPSFLRSKEHVKKTSIILNYLDLFRYSGAPPI